MSFLHSFTIFVTFSSNVFGGHNCKYNSSCASIFATLFSPLAIYFSFIIGLGENISFFCALSMELKQQIVQVSGEYADCRELAESLKEYGLVIVKDVRASEKDNDTFIDMMETYFEQTDFKRDARPNIGYQVGVTPPNTERPKNYCSKKHSSIKNTPLTICPPELDHKCRFFWRMGPRPLVRNIVYSCIWIRS